MFLGLYPLEPGFIDYHSPLTKFFVPGDDFNNTAVDLVVAMLRKKDVEVRAEHDFSCEARLF